MESEVFPPLFKLLVSDIFTHIRSEDRAYFRETREKRLGKTIERCAEEAQSHLEPFRESLAPAKLALEEEAYLCGAAPAYADYILMGSFQWARGISSIPIIEPDDGIYAWLQRMLDLYDGLGRSVPAYDY